MYINIGAAEYSVVCINFGAQNTLFILVSKAKHFLLLFSVLEAEGRAIHICL